MAKISSITIGKGTGSIGNVTLSNVGGVTVAKQKIASNKSNTALQAKQRGEFKRIMNMLRVLAYFSRLAFSREGTRSAWARFAKSWYAAGHRLAVTPDQLSKGLHFLLAAADIAVEDDPTYSPVLQEGSTSAVTVQYFRPEEGGSAYLLIRGSASDLTITQGKAFPCEVSIVESLYQVPARYASANAEVVFGSVPPLGPSLPAQHTVFIDSIGGFTYLVPLGSSAAVESAQAVRDSGWPLISIGGVRPRLLFKDWWSIAS